MDFDGSWTNEKHICFLNWIEASFVRTMHESDDHPSLTYALDGHMRLDRYLPDSAESTLDFKHRPNGKETHSNKETVEANRARDVRENQRRTREGSSRGENAEFQDQVVPQLESMKRK